MWRSPQLKALFPLLGTQPIGCAVLAGVQFGVACENGRWILDPVDGLERARMRREELGLGDITNCIWYSQ